jgi:hypothetical protein
MRFFVYLADPCSGFFRELLQARDATLRHVNGPLQLIDLIGGLEVVPLDCLFTQTSDPIHRMAQVLFKRS